MKKTPPNLPLSREEQKLKNKKSINKSPLDKGDLGGLIHIPYNAELVHEARENRK